MQLADDVRSSRDFGERATAEHEVDPAAPVHPGRTKATTGHLFLQQIHAVAGAGELGGTVMPVLSARLTGILLAANGIAQDTNQA